MKFGVANVFLGNKLITLRIKGTLDTAHIDAVKFLSFLNREENVIHDGFLTLKYGMGDVMITFFSTTYLSYASNQEIADMIEYLTIELLLK